jgi:hypothetical protein
MSPFRAKSIIRRGFVRGLVAVGVTAFVVSSASAPALASGGAAMQIYVTISQYSPAPTTLLLNVEGSDSIENVKQKVDDVTELVPAEMCLVYSGEFLQEGNVLDDYSIEEGDTLELFTLPVTAAWSITPDEPYLGGTVSNAIITHPGVTHAEVVAGNLPAGVTLNQTTGQVEGTFAQPGAFDVTIAADTICGSSELTWSGTVSGSASNALPETGRNVENFAAVLGIGALSFIAGLFITAIRWRRKAPHAL